MTIDKTPKGINRSKVELNRVKAELQNSEEGKAILDQYSEDDYLQLINTAELEFIPGEARSPLLIEQITNVVMNDLLIGKTRLDIFKRINQDYKIANYNIAKKFIDRARKVMINLLEEDRHFIKHRVEMLLDELYKMNIDKGDLRECRAVLAEKSKLFGLYEPDKLAISSDIIQFRFNTTEIKQGELPSEETDFEDITDEDV
jgi:hypothetical protein